MIALACCERSEMAHMTQADRDRHPGAYIDHDYHRHEMVAFETQMVGTPDDYRARTISVICLACGDVQGLV